MIHYLCTRKHLYTLGQFLRSWAPDLADRFNPIAYEDVAALSTPQPGAYVFSDLERLTHPGMQVVVRFRRSLDALGDRVRVLNDPTRVLRRYELLRALHEARVNPFDAYRVTEVRRPRTWPVLLRREFDHRGAIGKLLETNEQLDEAVAAIVKDGHGLEGVIAIEYCETADEHGMYRKYGAFIIGDRIVPRHLLFSRQWCLKDPDLLEPERIEEELRYLRSFPHADEVRRIFQLAHIDYGRIDYSFQGDRLRAWEINTNPMLIHSRLAEPGAPRRDTSDHFAALARDAFLALDAPFT